MIDLAFITGEISHDDLSLLASEDLSTQAGDLKEDMLQVKYPSSILLDVGWHPSFDLDGLFQIRVIRDYDWNDPVFFSEATTIPLLIGALVQAQKKINSDFETECGGDTGK